MEELVNSVIAELETFEANVLAPFFQNPDTLTSIIIGLAAVAIFYNVSNKIKKLFDNVTYRLIWVLLIVLATLYNPFVGFLTAIIYVMFMRPSSESFANDEDAQCPPKGDDFPVQEPESFAQEQLEILESNQESTHLKRVIEGSKEVMDKSIQ
jgi:hypothetical protein